MLSIKSGTSFDTIKYALDRVKSELGYPYLTYDSQTRLISVVSQNRCAERLLKSNFFNKHKDIGQGYAKYIDDIDVQLTLEEKRVVEVLMDSLRQCVDGYGWRMHRDIDGKR